MASKVAARTPGFSRLALVGLVGLTLGAAVLMAEVWMNRDVAVRQDGAGATAVTEETASPVEIGIARAEFSEVTTPTELGRTRAVYSEVAAPSTIEIGLGRAAYADVDSSDDETLSLADIR